MNRKINALIKAAASLSLAGGILTATTGPAFAASPNEAYAAQAGGVISSSELFEATFPGGTSPVTALSASITGLLTTGVVTDTATATSASSDVANVNATLATLVTLQADAVSSSCHFDTNTGTVSGTSSILNGSVVTVGGTTIALAASAPPNTTVNVPGVATITLNRQTTAPDGTLTVDAIFVSLLGGTQTLTIATSECNAANLAPISILPGPALPIGLGALTLLLLGGAGYQVSRRRRQATAA